MRTKFLNIITQQRRQRKIRKKLKKIMVKKREKVHFQEPSTSSDRKKKNSELNSYNKQIRLTKK